MMRLLFLALVSLLPAPAAGNSILAIFSHPDDETTVGSMLAKYVAAGHDVYLVAITSG